MLRENKLRNLTRIVLRRAEYKIDEVVDRIELEKIGQSLGRGRERDGALFGPDSEWFRMDLFFADGHFTKDISFTTTGELKVFCISLTPEANPDIIRGLDYNFEQFGPTGLSLATVIGAFS